MGDGIGQLDEAPLIEEKHESSMRLPSLPARVLGEPGAAGGQARVRWRVLYI